MKTIGRLRELVAQVKDGLKELTAKGMAEWSNADGAVYNALPALLAVVEAAEVIATTHAPLGASQVLRTVRVDQLEALDAALRKLDEVMP